MQADAALGMNSLEWDLLVDQELALAAEAVALEQMKNDDDAATEESPTNLAQTPYAESVRLGHALYVIPGDYKVRVSVGENSDSTELKVNAPEPFEPRFNEPYKLRGRK
jgi:hypothetical protein